MTEVKAAGRKSAGKLSSIWDVDSFLESGYHIGSALLPFFIAFFISIFTAFQGFWHFMTEGDICLFSAAILTPGVYNLSRYSKKNESTDKKADKKADKKNKKKPFGVVIFFSNCVIIGAALLYALVFLHSQYSIIPLKDNLVLIFSVIFLVYSIIIFYYSKFIDREISEFDYSSTTEREFSDFETNYNQ